MKFFEKTLNFQNFKFFQAKMSEIFYYWLAFFEKLIYGVFRFGIIGFGSVNLTEISVSVVSVFARFGRTLPSVFYMIYTW